LKRWSGLGPRHTQQKPNDTDFSGGCGSPASRTPSPQDSRGPREVTVTSFAGDEPESGITHPKPARPLIRRYSELLDPTQLDSLQVRSPSGNMLTGSTYNLREDRPLSVRERQERTEQAKEKVKKEQEMARGNRRKKDSAKASAKNSGGKRSKKRGKF